MKIGVVRNTPFLPSEPFITDQILSYAAVSPVLLSRDRVQRQHPLIHSKPFAPSKISAARYTLGLGDAYLKRTVEENQLALIHAHFGVEGLQTYAVSQRLDIPHFVTLHGYDVTRTTGSFLKSRSPSWIRYGIQRERFLKNSYTQFVCVSESIKAIALSKGVREEQTIVVPMGVDTELLQPRSLPNLQRIVHVARLVEKKGTAYLIQAMVGVLSEFPSATLTVIGDGPLRSDLEALVHELGLSHALRFMGALDHAQVIQEISASDLLVLPSVTAETGDAEGLGQVLLEAQALGRPVIGTKHGGIPETMIDGRTGVLVEERSVSGLTGAIIDIFADESKAAEMAREGVRHVRDNFDVKTGAAKLESAYSRILEGA